MQPFVIRIDDAELEDLRARLETARLPRAVRGVDWQRGTPPDVLEGWLERWKRFDWRAAEARLNRFPQFNTGTGGTTLHFVHVRAAREDATPILLLNGWPSTFAELLPLVDRLTSPTSGGRAFHVVIPSLPGFGFSPAPTEAGWGPTRMAGAMAELMTELGYSRFAVHGSDLGAAVMLALEKTVPERLIGSHTVNVYWGYPRPDDASEEEKAWLEEGQSWNMSEGAYAMIQATKPHTLGAGLSDSPAGLAAWALEKWNSWSDGGLDSYEPDDILTTLSIFWFTDSLATSIHMYAETYGDKTMQSLGKSQVPSGALIMPADILPAPRSWGERWLNLVHWTEADRGGHFAATEAPDLVADDIRATFDAIDGTSR